MDEVNCSGGYDIVDSAEDYMNDCHFRNTHRMGMSMKNNPAEMDPSNYIIYSHFIH